jgi:2-C-methyl-D-erythritol 4-phosphate cytidylyltransferase
MRVTAIVPAAGSGVRFGGVVPKQYLPLVGLPLLAWTLKALAASGRVDRLVLVVPPGQEARCRAEVLVPHGITADRVLAGGADRQASVCAGLAGVPADTDLVLVHDGARPLVAAEIVRAAIAAAAEDGAAAVAIPVTDTIKVADAQCRVAETLPRGRLWAAQTPQVFRAAWLREAHARAMADGFRGTDDAVLVERLGYPVRLVPGSPENLKITTMADLAQAEQILRGRITHDRQMTNDQ